MNLVEHILRRGLLRCRRIFGGLLPQDRTQEIVQIDGAFVGHPQSRGHHDTGETIGSGRE